MNHIIDFFSNFFKGPASFSANKPYIFNTAHIIFIVFTIISIPLLAYFLRKTDHKKIKKYLIIYWITATVLEVFKIAWETVQIGRMNWGGLLPLYLCSIPLYIMPLAIWGKGKVKHSVLAFISTFAIIGGIANTVMPTILNDYPLFTSFAGTHSMVFHYFMIFTGVFLWTSGYYKPKVSDIFWAWLPLAIFSVPVIILNYTFGWDYMFYSGGFFPFSVLSNLMPKPVWTIFLFFGYMAVGGLLFYGPFALITLMKKRYTSKKKLKEAPENN